MSSAQFDYAPLLPAGLPAPAARWTGLAKYSFVGGNNDPDGVPVDGAGRRGQRRPQARGQVARNLRPGKRPAGLSAAARIPREKAQARRRHRLHRRRPHDRLRLAAGARPRQQHAADARRHRDLRKGILSGLDQPPDAPRRQHCRHSPRRRGHADGCAGQRARRAQGQGRHAEIYLHHPDRAEPDRQHPAGGAPRRDAAAVRAIWRADLRGRLLCRPDLGRQAPARDLRHEQDRQRHPYRLVLEVDRAGAARRLHRRALGDDVADAGAEDRRRLRRAGADGARRISARRISRPMCRN